MHGGVGRNADIDLAVGRKLLRAGEEHQGFEGRDLVGRSPVFPTRNELLIHLRRVLFCLGANLVQHITEGGLLRGFKLGLRLFLPEPFPERGVDAHLLRLTAALGGPESWFLRDDFDHASALRSCC